MSPCSSDYILTDGAGLWRIVSEDSSDRRISRWGTLLRDPRAFIEYANRTISRKPSSVRCLRSSIIRTICAKRAKSFRFSVCNGYRSKKGITLSRRSRLFLTTSTNV